MHGHGPRAMGKQLQHSTAQGAAGHHEETNGVAMKVVQPPPMAIRLPISTGARPPPINIAVVMMPLAVEVERVSATAAAAAVVQPAFKLGLNRWLKQTRRRLQKR